MLTRPPLPGIGKNLIGTAEKMHGGVFALLIIGWLILLPCAPAFAYKGFWEGKVISKSFHYKVSEPKNASKDFAGGICTVVYLENLAFKKVGQISNKNNVRWLLKQGYRVVEIDYEHTENAKSPYINRDIIAINDSIAAGSFCGLRNCSKSQSYVLFEGYRIKRNVSYFKDDPTVYNTPDQYTEGDSLHMDIIYPANSIMKVPVVLSFSYSNSFPTFDPSSSVMSNANKNQRLNLDYTLSGFNDSFLEGAPACGIAWAIADHPKYCQWGKGKPLNGKNDTYKSYQTNPDAVRKVKSAIRTLRAVGTELGLSGNIGIYGFSRGSTAGSLAVGDRRVEAFMQGGLHHDVCDKVQAAVLGPGVFDYTIIYDQLNDGDSNLELRCPWAWGPMKENLAVWQTMGSYYLVESSASAPVFFFYNRNDDPYYQKQVAHLKRRLDELGVYNTALVDFGKGHAVPQRMEDLKLMYDFLREHLTR